MVIGLHDDSVHQKVFGMTCLPGESREQPQGNWRTTKAEQYQS